MLFQHLNSRIAFLLCLGAISGCGGNDGPSLGLVTGKVTLDGAPAERAIVTFTPESGPPSYGGTNAAGEYSMMFTADKNGAVVGKHNVTIESANASTGDDGKAIPDQKITKVPKKYGKAGTLTADVKAGPNTIDFALDSK